MLELKDVRFSVTDEKGQLKNIINGINLKIDEGKFVAITGPNGSGKSTLAKLIVGIIKPTSGQILYNGQDITEMSITDRAKLGISFAFQQPPELFSKSIPYLSSSSLISLSSSHSNFFLPKKDILSQYV